MGGHQRSRDSQGFTFAEINDSPATPQLIELRPLPRPTSPWLKAGLAAGGLATAAVVGWSLYSNFGSAQVETANVSTVRSDDQLAGLKLAQQQVAKNQGRLEEERRRSKEFEQQAAASHTDRDPLVHDLLVRERARTKALEQQATGGPSDRDVLARDRARRQELEQQLALRKNDAYLLAEEQARSKELAQQLANDRDLPAR